MTRAAMIDSRWVADKRAARVGWPSIARMAGVSEIDLRRAHDMTFVGEASAAFPRRAESPRELVRKALERAGLPNESAIVISRLWHANGARLQNDALARGIAGGGLATDVCREAKRRAEQLLGLRFVRGSGIGFQLSPESIVRVSDLACLPREDSHRPAASLREGRA